MIVFFIPLIIALVIAGILIIGGVIIGYTGKQDCKLGAVIYESQIEKGNISIPNDFKVISLINSINKDDLIHNKLSNEYSKYKAWKDNHYFHILLDNNNINMMSIARPNFNKSVYYKVPIDDIIFITREDTEQVLTNVTGGHSSFSILTGFHGKVNKIKTTHTTIGEKSTSMYISNTPQDIILKFGFEDYGTISTMLPEKDIDRIQSKSNNVIHKDIKERLDDIEELRKQGYITESEYTSSRDKILNEM